MEKTIKGLALEKHTSTHRLVIPADVERKIRHLCNMVSQVEWSGTLFYTHSGSYEEGDLEIRCVDIFPMDIGSQTYTEFDMSPDVIAYMTAHPELLDCQMGLIHSHNSMPSFFSGTDLNTLKEEGNDRNHFVSLIVNNAGKYTAAITRKLTLKKIINSTYTYKTFDDIEKTGTSSEEIKEEVIAYNMLDIIKEGDVIDSFSELDKRLETIKASKAVPVKTPVQSTYQTKYPLPPLTYNGQDKEVGKHVQQTLFDEEYMESEPPRKVFADPNEPEITISASVVRAATLQLITGSIAIADASRIDPVKWTEQMVRLFDKRFENSMETFELWAEILTEFIISNFIPLEYHGYEEEYMSKLCEDIYMSIDKLPENKYIKVIKETLILWMK